MAVNLVDIMSSLTLIMTEETERLQAYDRSRDLAELVSAKVRLTGILETELARLGREEPDWQQDLDEEGRAALSAAVVALGNASSANAAVVERQLELSNEVLGAVTAEARRQLRKRAETYSMSGALSPADGPLPISVNSQF